MARRHRRPSCVYCGADNAQTIDHVIPLSRARELRLARRILDNPSNRVPCCLRCNADKADRHPREWLDEHPEYRRRFRASARFLSDTVRLVAGLDE